MSRDPKNFFEERGDIPVNYPEKPQIPWDTLIKDDIRQAPKQLGQVPDIFSVRSTFATRPVNAHDVLVSDGSVEHLLTDLGVTVISITIPPQTVFVCDKIYINLDSYPAAYFINNNAIQMALGINGSPVVGYSAADVSKLIETFIPCYMIGGPGDVFTVTLTTTVLAGINVHVDVNFGGTYLLYQGRAIQYEIANPKGSM